MRHSATNQTGNFTPSRELRNPTVHDRFLPQPHNHHDEAVFEESFCRCWLSDDAGDPPDAFGLSTSLASLNPASDGSSLGDGKSDELDVAEDGYDDVDVEENAFAFARA